MRKFTFPLLPSTKLCSVANKLHNFVLKRRVLESTFLIYNILKKIENSNYFGQDCRHLLINGDTIYKI